MDLDYEVWTTREGKEIPVVEMGTDHIRKCIRMIQGHISRDVREGYMYDRRISWIRTFESELTHRRVKKVITLMNKI